MSADNWTKCPKCKKQVLQEYNDKQKAIKDAYGVVSEEKYNEMCRDAENTPSIENTLREDYEIYQRKGVVIVSYGCMCTDCGFKFNFEHREEIKIK